MKRLIPFGAISLIAVLFFVGTASASGGGNPWDRVWAAIQDLQDQITRIQLIPGPAGPQGSAGVDGVQGPVGPQGPQGSAGSGITRSSVYYRFSPVSIPPSTTGSAEASCDDENDVALSGGFLSDYRIKISYSTMSFAARSGWVAGGLNESTTDSVNMQVNVYCLRVL